VHILNTRRTSNSQVRLQRRDFFRLKPPVANPLKCQIPILAADGSNRLIAATVAGTRSPLPILASASVPSLRIDSVTGSLPFTGPNRLPNWARSTLR